MIRNIIMTMLIGTIATGSAFLLWQQYTTTDQAVPETALSEPHEDDTDLSPLSKAEQGTQDTIALLISSIAKSEKSQDDATLRKTYAGLASLYDKGSNREQAILYWDKLATLHKRLDEHSQAVHSYNRIGFLYMIDNNYQSAADAFHNALELADDINDKARLAHVYHNLGQSYMLLEEPQKSLEYYTKALAIHKKMENNKALADGYNALAILFRKNEKIAEAEKMEILSLMENIKLKRDSAIIKNYIHLAIIYGIQQDMDQSCRSWQEALAILQKPAIAYPGDRHAMISEIERALADETCQTTASGFRTE